MRINSKKCLLVFISALVMIIFTALTTHAEATPERTKIYLNINDVYTIDTEQTLGSDEFLSANWYSSDSSIIKINGSNYNKSACDITALASSAGKIVIVRVDFQYVGVYPEVPGVYTNSYYYYFVVRGENPQSIALPESAQITDAEQTTLIPEIAPKSAETACQWSSSNEDVAKVDSSGVVTGVSKGTAIITAETVNGLTASCTVTVRSSRTCGDELEWNYADGTLTISGTGDMYDYSYDSPWAEYSDKITKIIVSEGATSIGSHAFAGCAASEIVLPESLISIGEEAFSLCENLESISIPSGVRTLNGDPFSSYNLSSISVSPDNQYYSSLDGILFDKDMTRIVRYPAGREGDTYSIARHVDSIAFSAFYNTKLKKLYVPETITEIEYYGISTRELTVYGIPGSAAEKAVNEYNSLAAGTIHFTDITKEEPMMISLSDVYASYGDKISVPIALSGNKGFSNLNIQIRYDTSVLSLNSVNSADTDAMFTLGPNINSGLCNMSWNSAKNIMFNGTIATLEFEITDHDFSGRSPISISFYTGLSGDYIDGVDVNYDQSYSPLELVYTSGSVAEPMLSNRTNIVNIDKTNGIKFCAELSSVEPIAGTVAAAIYDYQGKLIGIQLYNASDKLDISFTNTDNASSILVMWLYSLNSMQPAAKSVSIDT